MILIADIGNTDSVIGLYPRRRRSADLRLSNDMMRRRHQLWTRLRGYLSTAGIAAKHIEGAAISSVVPRLTTIYSSVIAARYHIRPLVIDGSLDVGMKIHYDDPLALGADRICNAVAAFHYYGGPVIVIDCGTATTFDVVTSKGEYAGGAIAPGIRTSAQALVEHTARLPNVTLRFPGRVVARNTVAAIQSGVLYSSLDGMKGVVERMKRTAGMKTMVILTGGFASLMASESDFADAVHPTLVLDGAYLIYRRVMESKLRRHS